MPQMLLHVFLEAAVRPEISEDAAELGNLD